MNLARRWRANAGWLALLALLCFAAALLVTAAPRMVNRYTDEGLREWISSLSYTARDVSYVAEPEDQPPIPVAAERIRAQLGNEMPPALGDRVGGSWYATEIAASAAIGPDLTRRGAEVGVREFVLSLRVQSGAEDAVRLVDGAWPRNPQAIVDRVEAVVSAEAARDFGLRVGSTVDIIGGTAPVPVRIVGIFEPLDPAAPVWVEEPVVLDALTPVGTDPPQPWQAVLLTDTDGVSYASPRLGGHSMTWRFRLDESAITMADLPAVIGAVVEAKDQDVVEANTMTSLDMSLADFDALAGSARALLAIVEAGVTVALFGLVVLAGVVATGRRRNELALLRSRGASLPRLAGHLLAEAAPVVVLAVAGAYGLSLAVPGRPGDSGWLGLVFGVAATLTTPVLAIAQHRRVSVAGSRGDLVRPRVSPRRVTAELTLIVVAVAGVLALRRRGLATGFSSSEPAGSQVDIYLALTPALVAAAAAVLVLRLLPYPLRLLAGAAARARGAVGFLGLARAGRAAPASAGPVAVLVIAVSVGMFCAAVPASLTVARDRVADVAVPGDALIVGSRFPASTTEEFAAAPGVTAVAPMAIARQVVLRGGQITRAQSGITVVVVDAPALDRVLRTTGSSQTLPAALVSAEGDAGVAPAVVSPDIAAALDGAEGGVPVQGLTVSFTVAAVAPVFPGLERGARFVVLPTSALPASLATRLEPTAFALAGTELDTAELTRIGDTAQRAWVGAVHGRPYEGPLTTPTTVLTQAQARADLERRGVDVVLDFAFGLGLGSGLLLALLAVGFAVAIGARGRGEALSRLRTMGLARGQGRRLLAYELLPLILAGALVGSVVGAALPLLLGPALGLATFSDGGEVAFVLDPSLPGLGFGLVVLAVVVAMVVEASMNRRARLGSVLRVGGES